MTEQLWDLFHSMEQSRVVLTGRISFSSQNISSNSVHNLIIIFKVGEGALCGTGYWGKTRI
jgi:hypothetical protein